MSNRLPQGNIDGLGALTTGVIYERWYIEGTLVHSNARTDHISRSHRVPKSLWNTIFYDKQSGEAYGRRISYSHELPFVYVPGRYPEITLFSESPRDVPDSVFEFYLNYLMEKAHGTDYTRRYPDCL